MGTKDCQHICGESSPAVGEAGKTGEWRDSSGTTPILGKQQNQKDITAIMKAHGIPYAATANASYPLDLYEKVRKAKTIRGIRFIHVFIPCSPGWGFPFSDTIKIGKLAVETGLGDTL